MNFGREQSLLRQRLQAKGSAAHAASQKESHGTTQTFLGTAEDEVAAAARDLAAAFPAMGRAQMTAFVRTLWKSRIHELRASGVHLLALRHQLLEPADLPFLEELLGDDAVDAVLHLLADQVLGSLVQRHKKLWKDLQRLAGTDHERLRRAAARACRAPLQEDAEAFPRFDALAKSLLTVADAAVQQAIDAALCSAAPLHHEAASAFVREHGRTVQLPPPAPIAPAPMPTEAAAGKPKGQPPTDQRAVAAPTKKAAKPKLLAESESRPASQPAKPKATKPRKPAAKGKPSRGKPKPTESPGGKTSNSKKTVGKTSVGKTATGKPATKKAAGKLAARTR
ncbi:MAG: DNA alkylation repair protein [Planctomycetes bacterium]|nr:DNA alkylation repair protein [Planctomycetota bacterium]